MSGLLWKALRSPQWQHPIFRYARNLSQPAASLAWYWRYALVLLTISFAGFAAFFPIPAFLSLLALALAIPAIIIIFNGTLLGLYWVGRIAEMLARENRNGRIELLSLTPDGSFGANWQLASGVIYRHDLLNRVYRLIKTSVSIVLVLLAVALLLLLLGAFSSVSASEREQQLRVFLDVLALGLLLLFFWADHIQSIILALLLGLLLPYYLRDEILLRLFAPLSFLIVQLLTYVLALTLFLALLNTWMQAYLLLSSLGLLLFCALRELLLRLIWQLYLQQSQAVDAAQIVRI